MTSITCHSRLLIRGRGYKKKPQHLKLLRLYLKTYFHSSLYSQFWMKYHKIITIQSRLHLDYSYPLQFIIAPIFISSIIGLTLSFISIFTPHTLARLYKSYNYHTQTLLFHCIFPMLILHFVAPHHGFFHPYSK